MGHADRATSIACAAVMLGELLFPGRACASRMGSASPAEIEISTTELRWALGSGSPDWRQDAAIELAKRGDASIQVLDELKVVLRSSDSARTQAALEAIRSLGPKAGFNWDSIRPILIRDGAWGQDTALCALLAERPNEKEMDQLAPFIRARRNRWELASCVDDPAASTARAQLLPFLLPEIDAKTSDAYAYPRAIGAIGELGAEGEPASDLLIASFDGGQPQALYSSLAISALGKVAAPGGRAASLILDLAAQHPDVRSPDAMMYYPAVLDLAARSPTALDFALKNYPSLGDFPQSLVETNSGRFSPTSIRELEILMRSDQEPAASLAAETLGMLGRAEAAPFLIKCVDKAARAKSRLDPACLKAFAGIGAPGVSVLRGDLRSSDEELKRAALAALESSTAPKDGLIDELLPLTTSAESGLRPAALALLGDMRKTPPERLIPTLRAALRDEDSQQAAVSALDRLGLSRTAIPELTKIIMRTTDANLCNQAAAALAHSASASAVDGLLERVADPDSNPPIAEDPCALEILRLLGNIRSSDARVARVLLTAAAGSDLLRGAAVQSLAKLALPSARAVPPLIELLRASPNTQSWVPLAEALSHVGPPAKPAIPLILEKLRDQRELNMAILLHRIAPNDVEDLVSDFREVQRAWKAREEAAAEAAKPHRPAPPPRAMIASIWTAPGLKDISLDDNAIVLFNRDSIFLMSRSTVTALDKATGAIRWSVGTETALRSARREEDVAARPWLTTEGERVYTVLSGKKSWYLMAFDARSGRISWISPLTSPGTGLFGMFGSAFANGTLFISALESANCVDNHYCSYIGNNWSMTAFDSRDGSIRWRRPATEDLFSKSLSMPAMNTPAFDDRAVYFATPWGQMLSIDPANGALRWSFGLGAQSTTKRAIGFTVTESRVDWLPRYGSSDPIVVGPVAVFVAPDDELYAIETATGRVLWKKPKPNDAAANIKLHERTLCWDSPTPECLDPLTGSPAPQPAKMPQKNRPEQTIVGGSVWLSDAGGLTALNPETGSVVAEYAVPFNSYSGRRLMTDGSSLYALHDGQLTKFPLPARSTAPGAR